MMLILVLLALLAYPITSNAQLQVDWQTTKICDTCRPSICYSTTPNNLIVYTEPLQDHLTGYLNNSDRRTYDGGRTWTVFRDSVWWGVTDVGRDAYYSVSPATYFQKIRTAFAYTLDSGKSWTGLPAYPVPFAFRMSTAEKGIGTIYDTLNGQYVLELRETIDSGRYWYDYAGVSYTSPLRPYKARFLSDSEVLVLLVPSKQSGAAAVVKTSDKGVSWHKVLEFSAEDTILPLFISSANYHSDVLLLESWGHVSLMISLDRGETWRTIADDLDNAASRTRVSASTGQPLRIWAAVASDHAGSVENLLEPNSWPHVYPSRILLSEDTGRTWIEQDFYPPGLDSVQIFDIIPDGDRIYVVSYFDSTTYVSTATISGLGSVNATSVSTPWLSLYPNPVVAGGSVSLDAAELSVSRYVITDALGVQRAAGMVTSGKLDLDSRSLPIGAYSLLLYLGKDEVARAKLVVQ